MKKALTWAVAGAVAVLFILILRIVASDVSDSTDPVFHVLLSDSAYKGGQYTESFEMAAGSYKFKFIANGDSPQTLTIIISSEAFSFSENFALDGTLHKTGLSEYYTWNYVGQEEFELMQGQALDITIDPNGNTVGTVSVLVIPR